MNDDWKRLEESMDDSKCMTIGYKRTRDNSYDIFLLSNRKKSSEITLPDMAQLIDDELLDKILNIIAILERALGKEICDTCFPEPIRTLSQFSK